MIEISSDRKGIILHQDNANRLTSQLTERPLKKILNLLPFDYQLFKKLKIILNGFRLKGKIYPKSVGFSILVEFFFLTDRKKEEDSWVCIFVQN